MVCIKNLKLLVIFAIFISAFVITSHKVSATQLPVSLPNVELKVGTAETPEQINRSLQILILLNLIAISPYLLLMLTTFPRILITFHFLRSAMATQQMPPNQILIALTLFLTFFTMGPTLTTINKVALQPFSKGEITQSVAIEKAMEPIREFMFKQVEIEDINLFSSLAKLPQYANKEEMVKKLPNYVLIPSFMLGELTKAFKIGVILFIPFIVIDMVVASTLMAMGMMMLPPAMISLPFKILFFIMVDGWRLVIEGVILTFN